MNPIVIPLSKVKLFFLFSGCLVIGGLGLWLYMNPYYDFGYGPEDYKYFGLGLAIIAFIAALFRLRWLVRTEPALMITNEGIVDHCSAVKAGLVRWQNIVDVNIDVLKAKKAKRRILVIQVNNMPEILNNKHLFTKLRVWLNAPWGKDKLRFDPGIFKMNLDELKELIEVHWKDRTTRGG